MHNTLGDALVVEVGDFLPGVKILQQCRPALAGGQRIVSVVDANALLSRQVARRPINSVTVKLLLLYIGLISVVRNLLLSR